MQIKRKCKLALLDFWKGYTDSNENFGIVLWFKYILWYKFLKWKSILIILISIIGCTTNIYRQVNVTQA